MRHIILSIIFLAACNASSFEYESKELTCEKAGEIVGSCIDSYCDENPDSAACGCWTSKGNLPVYQMVDIDVYSCECNEFDFVQGTVDNCNDSEILEPESLTDCDFWISFIENAYGQC